MNEIDQAENTADSSQTPPGDPATEDASGAPDIEAGILEAIDDGLADASGEPPPEKDGGEKAEDGEDDEGEETPEGEDAADPAAQAEAGAGDGDKKTRKKADHVNDPIPEDVAPRTRKRIESLVETVKTQGQELETLRSEQRELFTLIERTGATPEQWADAMQFLGASLSDDPKEKRAALEYAQQQVERLALELGEKLPGVDLLKNHPDLRDAVDVGDITEERAIELARYRDQQKRGAESQAQQPRQPAGAPQAQDPETAAARSELNALGAFLRETDPDFERKMRVLLPELQPIMKKTPPAQWRAKFTEYYKAVKLADAPARGEPARGRQPAGRQQKTAQSPLEAIELGLEEASR